MASFSLVVATHYIACQSVEPTYTKSLAIQSLLQNICSTMLAYDMALRSWEQLHGEPLCTPPPLPVRGNITEPFWDPNKI